MLTEEQSKLLSCEIQNFVSTNNDVVQNLIRAYVTPEMDENGVIGAMIFGSVIASTCLSIQYLLGCLDTFDILNLEADPKELRKQLFQIQTKLALQSPHD